MDLCSRMELVKAAGWANALRTTAGLSRGAQIEAAMHLIKSNMRDFDPDQRDNVIAHLVQEVFALRSDAPGCVDANATAVQDDPTAAEWRRSWLLWPYQPAAAHSGEAHNSAGAA